MQIDFDKYYRICFDRETCIRLLIAARCCDQLLINIFSVVWEFQGSLGDYLGGLGGPTGRALD